MKKTNESTSNLDKILEKIVIVGSDRKPTHLVKPKRSPIWTGESFERFDDEVSSWDGNNPDSETIITDRRPYLPCRK